MNNILVYTVHKAASTFLNKIVLDITDKTGINYYSVNSDKYRDQIKTGSWKNFIENSVGQGCYGPIRVVANKPCIPDDLGSYDIIMHVRDPRDAVTSFFASNIYSHPKREGGFNPSDEMRKAWEKEGIDKFVLDKIDRTKIKYHILLQIMEQNDHVFLKYEELVTDYGSWLRKFLPVFGIDATNNYQYYFNKYKNDFHVDSEDPYRHKRQITPGDYLRKLSVTTIDRLNNEFSEILEKLGYE